MPRIRFGKPFVTCVSLLVGACLSANPGEDDTTGSGGTSSETGAEPSGPGETSQGGIMTTTEEPEDTGSSEDAGGSEPEVTTSTSSSTTPEIPPTCGDGVIDEDEGEECDNGNANADDAGCTTACKLATCGDGLVQSGKEQCDDGVNDGAYDGCLKGCAALAPHCGDGIVDAGVEECDATTPDSGCLKGQCRRAKSCLEIKQAWGDVPSGEYLIFPKNGQKAHCDMETDGGGYTFVKLGSGGAIGAAKAETECAKIGMQLLIPRTQAHLAASALVAANEGIKPIEGPAAPNASSYLRIFGIYPKTPGESCLNAALNKLACPEWQASDGGEYWISGMALGADEPKLNNCAGCSMGYFWNGAALTSYEVVNAGGVGYEATHFLCDVGDKPMN